MPPLTHDTCPGCGRPPTGVPCCPYSEYKEEVAAAAVGVDGIFDLDDNSEWLWPEGMSPRMVVEWIIDAYYQAGDLRVPYFEVASALGRALEHDTPEFHQVVAELDGALPGFAWNNAMTDSAATAEP